MIGDVQLLPLLGMLNLLGWAFGYHVQDFLVNVPSSTKTMEVCWNLETILPIGPTGKIHAEVVQITSYTAVLEFFWPASKKKMAHCKLCFGVWGRTHLNHYNHYKPPKTSSVFWKGLPAHTSSIMFCLESWSSVHFGMDLTNILPIYWVRSKHEFSQ